MRALETVNLICLFEGKKNDRLGRCYELAGRYTSNNPEAILVHGHLVNPFGKGLQDLDHAYVEIGDKIFDPVMDMEWPKEVYEQLFKVSNQKRYSHLEVLKNMCRHSHWGPWP
jgi:hypothetical protein